MAEKDPYTLLEMRRAVGRELALRRRVYPNMVRRRKLDPKEAEMGLEVFEALYGFLKGIEEPPPALVDHLANEVIPIDGSTPPDEAETIRVYFERLRSWPEQPPFLERLKQKKGVAA